MTTQQYPECVICKGDILPQRTPEGEIFWTHGHNAEPVATGQCCDDCNINVVLRERLVRALDTKDDDVLDNVMWKLNNEKV